MTSLMERVLSRTTVDGDCVIWTGANAGGYGQMRVNGRMTRVHRVVYEETFGAIPRWPARLPQVRPPRKNCVARHPGRRLTTPLAKSSCLLVDY